MQHHGLMRDSSPILTLRFGAGYLYIMSCNNSILPHTAGPGILCVYGDMHNTLHSWAL